MGSGDVDSGSRPIVMGLGALLVVTLLVGGLVSAVALGAAKLSGLGDSSGSREPADAPSLYIPSGEPTTTPEAYPDPSGFEKPEDDPSDEESASQEPTPTQRSRQITLQAFPLEVSPGERINLTGIYPAGEGAVLQVQRFEGAWTDFATVTARVQGGIYSTYVLTSRTGEARFRMTDAATGRSSNPVTVTIR